MMRITFGHMGTSVLVFESLLRDLGHEVISPDRPTAKTLTLGTQYAPEFACIPFKIVLGTYLETLPRGVDTILSAGGMGPCRAGYYGDLHQRIIRDLGYHVDMVFFFPPLKAPVEFVRKIKLLKGNHSWLAFWQHFKKCWKKMKALDDLERRAHQLRPLELNHGSVSHILRTGIGYLRESSSINHIKEARQAALDEMNSLPLQAKGDVLKIGMIGEIYVQLEPFANFEIEEILGKMGAEVKRSIFLTQYTREDVFADGSKNIKKLARPYLDQKIGGHGQNSIGETVHFAKMGYDGVVQLAPFTCIPEIVAKSIMPKLSKDLNIPVLTIFIDEQTGKAGVETRLEAFVDMLWEKKKRKDKKAV